MSECLYDRSIIELNFESADLVNDEEASSFLGVPKRTRVLPNGFLSGVLFAV